LKVPTLTDVARAAGVSYATADRVVNKRGNVTEKTTMRVAQAVSDLGYVRNVAAASLSQAKRARFVFILPDSENGFFVRIRRALDRQSMLLRQEGVSVQTLSVRSFEVPPLVDALESLQADPPTGVAIVGMPAPTLVAPLAGLTAKGVTVVSLVSDLPSDLRQAYVGLDNNMAGRTAARLMGMGLNGRKGAVQIVAGSLQVSDHADRSRGFEAVLRQDHPDFEILPVIEAQDDPLKVFSQVKALFGTRPDLLGIYSVGAGNEGLRKALKETAVSPFTITHEVVEDSRAALLEGTYHAIIDQRPEEEVSLVINILRAHRDRRDPPPPTLMHPTIYLQDNLPPE